MPLPGDHRTRGPQDQRTTGPEDHRTTGPEDHRSLNFFSRGCKYFFQGTWFFFPGNVFFFPVSSLRNTHLYSLLHTTYDKYTHIRLKNEVDAFFWSPFNAFENHTKGIAPCQQWSSDQIISICTSAKNNCRFQRWAPKPPLLRLRFTPSSWHLDPKNRKRLEVWVWQCSPCLWKTPYNEDW